MKKVMMGWTCSSNRVHGTCSVLVRILRSSRSSQLNEMLVKYFVGTGT